MKKLLYITSFMASMTTDEYWNNFLKEKNLPDTTPYGGEITFSNDEQDFAYLLALILAGKKTAQVSALPGYQIDFEPLPKKSYYYILNDWQGNPVTILKTTNVTILPFDEVTWEMAQKDGEESDLQSWREKYTEFFKEDSDLMGYDFTSSMPVVFEEFEIVYR